MPIANRHIVITGGTSGIGYELVKQLSAENACIVLARSESKLSQLKETFPTIETHRIDLTDFKSLKALCATLCEKHTKIDLLINNAASQSLPRITSPEFNLERIAQEINLNLLSVHYLIYGLLPSLKSAKKGRIWNINSGLAIAPKTESATYCATKAALYSLSLSLDYQLTEQGVRVSQAILPLVETPMTTGRGKGKMTAEHAAEEIARGIQRDKRLCYIGKVKLLAMVFRLSPSLARSIMKSY